MTDAHYIVSGSNRADVKIGERVHVSNADGECWGVVIGPATREEFLAVHGDDPRYKWFWDTEMFKTGHFYKVAVD